MSQHDYVCLSVCFFFNDTATTEIYTLPLHDALPIFDALAAPGARLAVRVEPTDGAREVALRIVFPRGSAAEAWPRLAAYGAQGDRKSTRLNSSHANISYAVFCLKKKNNINNSTMTYY